MFIVPFQVSETEYSVYVVLEKDNLARMRQNDPAEVTLGRLPEEWQKLKVKDIIIATPSEKDAAAATALIRQGEVRKALQFLSRGFQFKPQSGDHDRPYESGRGKAH